MCLIRGQISIVEKLFLIEGEKKKRKKVGKDEDQQKEKNLKEREKNFKVFLWKAIDI